MVKTYNLYATKGYEYHPGHFVTMTADGKLQGTTTTESTNFRQSNICLAFLCHCVVYTLHYLILSYGSKVFLKKTEDQRFHEKFNN